MRTNPVKRALKNGEPSVGTWLSLGSITAARFMARADHYSHEADGKTPAQRAQEQGYAYCIVLENIASLYSSEGFGTQELADRVMQGWKQSQGHRENMLDPSETDVTRGSS